MASIRITIETSNAAFHEGGDDPTLLQWEVARILKIVCARLVSGAIEDIGPLKDANGNTVGKVEILG